MTLLHPEIEQPFQPALVPVVSSTHLKYDQAIALAKDFMWDHLCSHTVGQALELWLATLGKLTALNYRSGMRKLVEAKGLDPNMSLQAFVLVNQMQS